MRKTIAITVAAIFVYLLLTACTQRSTHTQTQSTANKNEPNPTSNANDTSPITPEPTAATSKSEPPPFTTPTAVEIGKVLKDGGMPFTHEILDSTEMWRELKEKASYIESGMVTVAVTATSIADVSITVFQTSEQLHQAEDRMVKVSGPVYFAECGSILVDFSPDANGKAIEAAKAQAARAQAILKKHYKCN
jgi:cytoskeletal protein RodZ